MNQVTQHICAPINQESAQVIFFSSVFGSFCTHFGQFDLVGYVQDGALIVCPIFMHQGQLFVFY